MSLVAAVQSGWEARLQLQFALNDEGESVLASRLHKGPLVVQKPLYPEGKAVCHAILLHPPGGVAGGDSLTVDVTTASGSRALMTTPGAGKWYKSNARLATQLLHFRVQKASVFEWLPQETILFDGADVHWQTRIELEQDACYMGWEIVCFGRSASGEKFSQGGLRQETEIFCAGKRIWGEYASVAGGNQLLFSAAGLAGRTVSGTFLVAGALISDELLKALRAIELDHTGGAVSGISRMGKMVAVRYLGYSSELAKQYFSSIWSLLRPEVCGRVSCMPRIWNT